MCCSRSVRSRSREIARGCRVEMKQVRSREEQQGMTVVVVAVDADAVVVEQGRAPAD